MRRLTVFALCAACACSKRTADDPDRDLPASPVRIVFGPCASSQTEFQSRIEPRGTGASTRAFDPNESNATSPLNAISDAIVACARTHRVGYGVALVDFGASTSVAALEPAGRDHAMAQCLATAARRVRTEPQRCGVAFGTMPLADAHVIEVRSDAITLDGVQHGDPRAVIAETEQVNLGKLRDALARQNRWSAGASLHVTVPTMLRVRDTIPMKVVNTIVETVRPDDIEPVLTTQDSASWRALRTLALPAPPLPIGTRPPPLFADDDRRRLSLYIQKDRIWIGLVPAREYYDIPQVPDLGHDWDKVLAELRRTHEELANRDDIEIAADDDVPYVDVTRAIDVAMDSHFREWRLVVPARLSARPTL